METSLYPHENWWRLAVLLRALVVFSHAPSLDRLNLRIPDAVTVRQNSKSGIRGEDRTRPLGFGDQTDR
jgi:hypothetical protein